MICYDDVLFKRLLEKMSFILEAPVSFYDKDFQYNNVWGGHLQKFCYDVNLFCKQECTNSDMKALNEAQSRDCFYYTCHYGFIEMIFKITLHGKDFGYILIGPFRKKKCNDELIRKTKEYCELHQLNEKEMLSAYKQIPYFTEEKFEAVKEITYCLFEYAKKQNIIYEKDSLFETQIRDYIEQNLNKDLSIESLCNKYFFSPKQLSKIFLDATGELPKKYITKRRIIRAHQLIMQTDIPLPDIATEVGISDYNYFIKVFKKYYQHPPTYYRKEKR